MPDPAFLIDEQTGYKFKPHELPFLPGSPATPDHPAVRKVEYLSIGILLGLFAGAQNGFMLASTAALQADLALTPVEAGWVTVAFYSTYACMSMLLFRARQNFGIDRFVQWSLIALVFANFIQLLQVDFETELLVRSIAGVAAAGLTAMSIYYLMQGLPEAARVGALIISLGLVQIAYPLTRAISPALLIDNDISRVFQFQFAAVLLTLAAVYLLRLPPGQRQKTFEPLDIPSIALFMGGVAALFSFVIQGRIQWWDTPWLGWALAASILMLGGCWLIESNRRTPMLLTSWLSGSAILSIVIISVGVRVLVSEQSFGAAGLFNALGYSSRQLVEYNWVLTFASLLGLVASLIRLDPNDLRQPVIVAFFIIAIAAFADTRSGMLTRPQDLYLTQGVIAFAVVYALGPMLMEGLLRGLAHGTPFVISFVGIFSLSQNLGGQLGVSLLSYVHTVRTNTHLSEAADTLTLSNGELRAALQHSVGRVEPLIADPLGQQEAAAGMLTGRVAREAAVLAFNDVYFLVGVLATITFFFFFIPWASNRIRGHNPMAEELAALQALLERSKQ